MTHLQKTYQGRKLLKLKIIILKVVLGVLVLGLGFLFVKFIGSLWKAI